MAASLALEQAPGTGRRRWQEVLRTPLGISAVTLTGIVVLLAILGPLVWSGRAGAIDTDHLLGGPSAQHWAGTDNLGRDIFFRVLVATRLSLLLALAVTAIAVAIGIVLGTLPAVLGPRSGRFVVAVINVLVAFPGLLLALFFAVIFGAGARGAVFALGLGGAPVFARLCQTLVAGVAQRDYVAAARAVGVGRLRIVVRHILPNIAEPLVVNATVGAGGALLSFAGLSFLGLGVQAPSYDWGRLLQEGVGNIYENPLAALAPGMAVVLAGLSFNLVGEAVAKGLGTTSALRPLPRTTPAAAPPSDPAADRDDGPVLAVDDLVVTFPVPGGRVSPVRGVSFTIRTGEAVGVVGESGSGKSLTALAAARLIEDPGRVDAARLEFLGADLRHDRGHRRLLGTKLALVFQDPMTSFNPTRRIGWQVAEVAVHHQGLGRREALARAIDRLAAVRIHEPERRAHQYPHEFSGGMRQRAMIGMGLMGTPALVIADEPTTALDVTVQKQVLDLLAEVRREHGAALLLISHDVSVVRETCDRVLVMYAGRIVEDLPADRMLAAQHPYTRALVAAVPDMETDLDQPLAVIAGRPVDPARVPAGCAFAPRCPLASERCTVEDPVLVGADAADEHRVACWHPVRAESAVPLRKESL